MSGDIFGCHNWEDCYWPQAMEDARHPTVHRTAPTTENHLAQNVNGVTVEKQTLIEHSWQAISSFFISQHT